MLLNVDNFSDLFCFVSLRLALDNDEGNFMKGEYKVKSPEKWKIKLLDTKQI